MKTSRYTDAIFEHEQEDENGKSKNVYAYYGLAIYQSQCLEESFSLMLVTNRILKKMLKTNRDINDFMDKLETSKKTMGVFLNEVKQAYDLPEALKDDLSILLDTRNFLVHKYFKVNIQKFYSEVGQREMLKYFCDFVDRSRAMEDTLKDYYLHHLEGMGLTEEHIQSLMDEIISEEQERINS